MPKKIGLFAFGEMGKTAFEILADTANLIWVMLPDPGVQTQTEKETEIAIRGKKIPLIHVKRTEDVLAAFANQIPDLVLVCSYNKILPQNLLTKTKFVNVHLGDLPNFRGRANVNWAIILDMDYIGLTIHEMIPDLDAGNIFHQKHIPIAFTDTIKTVYEKICLHLVKHLAVVLEKVSQGDPGTKQVGTSTYCCTRLPQDGLIDWSGKTRDIYNFIRAQTKPYPGAFTFFDERKMTIWASELPKNPNTYIGRIPGRIAQIYKGEGVEILTGDGSILITSVTYVNEEKNAAEVIKSVKKTLGIDYLKLYEKMCNQIP